MSAAAPSLIRKPSGRRPGVATTLTGKEKPAWDPSLRGGWQWWHAPVELEKLIDRGILRGQDGLLQLRMVLEIGRRQYQFEPLAHTEPISDQKMASVLGLGMGRAMPNGEERKSLTRFRNLKRDGRRKGLWDWAYAPSAGQASCYSLTIEKWASGDKARPLHGRANDPPLHLPRSRSHAESDPIELNPGETSGPLENSENAAVDNRATGKLTIRCRREAGLFRIQVEQATDRTGAGYSASDPKRTDRTGAGYSAFEEKIKDILGPHCKTWKIPLKDPLFADIVSSVKRMGGVAGLDVATTIERFKPFIDGKFEDHAHLGRITGGLLKTMIEDFRDLLALDAYQTHDSKSGSDQTDRLIQRVRDSK